MVITTRPNVISGWRFGHEMREYFAIFVYLYICFGALLLYKTAILHGHGIGYAPYGLAAGKALLLSKFMLIGRKLGIGVSSRRGTLLRTIGYKAMVFFLLLIGLSVVEEVLIGLVHHRTLADTFARFGGRNLEEILATSLLLLLILIPYFAYYELDTALGKGQLRQLLWRRA